MNGQMTMIMLVIPILIGVLVIIPLVVKITKKRTGCKVNKENVKPLPSYDPISQADEEREMEQTREQKQERGQEQKQKQEQTRERQREQEQERGTEKQLLQDMNRDTTVLFSVVLVILTIICALGVIAIVGVPEDEDTWRDPDPGEEDWEQQDQWQDDTTPSYEGTTEPPEIEVDLPDGVYASWQELEDGTSCFVEDTIEGGRVLSSKRTYYAADGSPQGWTLDEWDENGYLIKSTSDLGDGWFDVSEYAADAGGMRIRLSRYYNGLPVYVSEYDDQGNEIKTTSYDDNGNKIGWWTMLYDTVGNPIKTVSYDANDAMLEWVEQRYDARGNVIWSYYYGSNGVLNGSEWLEYNENDQVTRAVRYSADGSVSEVQELEWNENGTTKKVTSRYADGRVGIREMDENGNALRDTSYYANGQLDSVWEFFEDKRSTRLQYDENGNKVVLYEMYDGIVVRWTHYYENGSYSVETREENDESTTVLYDAVGNVIERIEFRFGATNSIGRTAEEVVYDAQGNVLRKRVLQYQGDELISVKYYDGNGNLIDKIEY